MNLENHSPSRGCNEGLFVIPVNSDYLIYSPLQRIAAMVNRRAFTSLKEKKTEYWAGNSQLAPFAEMTVQDAPHPPMGVLQPAFLGLLPTRDCNFACLYCGFNTTDGKEKVMDLALAAAAVDWMAERSVEKQVRNLEVHFFGGEPFMAPEVVETVVHRTRQQAAKYSLRPVLEISTNGYCSEEWCRYVGDYFDSVVLSFDGAREIQDRYRPLKSGAGSYATVERTASSLSASQAKLCIRLCTTQETVSTLSETCDWFCSRFQPSILNFETLKPGPSTDALGMYPPDPLEYAVQYMKAAAVARRHGVEPVYAAASIDSLRHSFCPVGMDVAIVSPEGRVSGCYLLEDEWKRHGMDMEFGRLDAKHGMQIDQQAVERIRTYAATKSRCRCCIGRYHCAGGCHVMQSGLDKRADYPSFCVQTRMITICTLLSRLGYHETVNRLLTNRAVMKRIAHQPSDLIKDCH